MLIIGWCRLSNGWYRLSANWPIIGTSSYRMKWPLVRWCAVKKWPTHTLHTTCRSRCNSKTFVLTIIIGKFGRFCTFKLRHVVIFLSSAIFLSSLSWRDNWRVSWFNDFTGRLSLETKPRPKSWPTVSIVWRRLYSLTHSLLFAVQPSQIRVRSNRSLLRYGSQKTGLQHSSVKDAE